MGDNRDYAPSFPIEFLFKFRDRVERLGRFAKGDNKDAPMYPISLLSRSRIRIERLKRFARGDNRDYIPMSSN